MTVKPTPAPANPTGQLAARLGIPRYTGMDAYAQGLADRHVVSAGPYAQGVSANGSTGEAFAIFQRPAYGYHMIGIGYNDGFWVIVLNN